MLLQQRDELNGVHKAHGGPQSSKGRQKGSRAIAATGLCVRSNYAQCVTKGHTPFPETADGLVYPTRKHKVLLKDAQNGTAPSPSLPRSEEEAAETDGRIKRGIDYDA